MVRHTTPSQSSQPNISLLQSTFSTRCSTKLLNSLPTSPPFATLRRTTWPS
jgi:hypothetical protein